MTNSTEWADPPRFGRLTYSSFDRDVGVGGGWQVKATAGGLTDDEQESLRSRVVTHFDSTVPLPQFPTPDEIAGLPRRLAYAPVENAGAAYWHTAPAGVDGSGRPGNVFAHVVLDRTPSMPVPAFRPIELWRSPDWLTPFGPQQVLQAELDSREIPRDGLVLDRARVLDFLFDPQVWRFEVLGALLDAVAGARSGGPRVVLGVGSVDAAALWIGAVSHLMSAGSSRALPFSTYERMGSVGAAVRQGLLLLAVPLEDLVSLQPDASFVVIAENESLLRTGDPAAPHRTAAGSTIAVTEWSVIAGAAMLYRELAESVLDQLDQIAQEVGDDGLHPAWPLAMVVAKVGGELDEVAAEASAVIQLFSPPGLPTVDSLWLSAMAHVRHHLGQSTADVWTRLSEAHGMPERTAMRQLVLPAYVERVLTDESWLTADEPPPLPPQMGARSAADEWIRSRFAVALSDWHARSVIAPAHEGRSAALSALRLVDFGVRAGVLDATTSGQDAVNETANQLLERFVVPAVLDPRDGAAFIEDVGRVAERTLETFVRPLVRLSPAMNAGEWGRRLLPRTLHWLYPNGMWLPTTTQLEGGAGRTDPLMVEWLHQAMHDPGVALRPGYPRIVVAYLWSSLEFGEMGGPELDFAPFVSEHRLPVHEVLALLTRFGAAVAPRLATSALLGADDGPELDALIALLLRTAHPSTFGLADAPDSDATTLAGMRSARGFAWWRTEDDRNRVVARAEAIVHALARALRHSPADLLAHEVPNIAICAFVIAAVHDPDAPAIPALQALLQDTTANADAKFLTGVLEGVESSRISDARLVYAACRAAATDTANVTARIDQMAGLALPMGGKPVPILDQAIRASAATGGLSDPHAVLEELLNRLWADTDGASLSDDRERQFFRRAKAAKAWWAGLGLPGDGVFSSTKSLFRRS